jgi:nitrite reductase/ring-hydroxylating ferredoxin subunit
MTAGTVSTAAAGAGVRHRPTVVAHTSQLPEAGSFVTADAAGTPLLLVRQDDGSVRALANVCRHRGARVETEPAGRRKMFACPYHRWCYKRTGEIRSIPFDDGFTGVRKAALGLVEHPSARAGNLVWVVPDRSDPPDVPVPAELGRASLVRNETLELDESWAGVETRLTSAADMLTPGTFASWSDGWAEVITVRPAGVRLDRTAVGFWLLADGTPVPEGTPVAAGAGARWDERVAWLRAGAS